MPNLKASLIIAYYKDLEALGLIFDTLKHQTYKNFEVVVAEDDNASETRSFLAKLENSGLDISHVSHPDVGRTKSVAQNNAILAATGDYLIFIDGDCIPYSTFIESHTFLAEHGSVLSGRRVNLGPKISNRLRNKSLSPLTLEKFYLAYYPFLILDGASHIEQGIFLNPRNKLYTLSQKRKSNLSMLGCNFSCFKSDILEINGFDESYGESAVPDDTDLQWRFEAFGLQMKSCKLAANMYHLHHHRAPERYQSPTSPELERMLERKKTGNYKAQLGLDSH